MSQFSSECRILEYAHMPRELARPYLSPNVQLEPYSASSRIAIAQGEVAGERPVHLTRASAKGVPPD
jgi:hypothetical protein